MDIIALLASVSVQLIIAGGVGGAARAIFLKVTILDGLASIGIGAALGFYASPLFEPAIAAGLSNFAVDPDRLPGFTAFSTGVGGIAVIGFIVDWWRDKLGKPTKDQAVDPNSKTGG